MSLSNKKQNEILCYHCNDICPDESIHIDDKYFCCSGCKVVFEILNENNLCKYYDLDEKPGITPPVRNPVKYQFLEDEQIKKQLLSFSDGDTSVVTLYIPQMHCSSCIWLLENLFKLDEGITFSKVNFPEKKLDLKFNEKKTNLKKIAELLESIGYEPAFHLDAAEKKIKKSRFRKLYFKIGIAGFAFGNIMLLSFPEYLGLTKAEDPYLHQFFGYMNLLLALPVFFYSSSEYYISAYKGLKNRILNLDFPVFLGILVTFLRSVYEIVFQTGAGYMDSMTGLVFFLLIGKVFQSKTYDAMNFDRSYKSYFPLSAALLKNGSETSIPISKLKVGDRILIRNGELIPADSILFKGEGNIDYSFVTGESLPRQKGLGEILYAGGRQIGEAIEMEVLKDVSQSYLTNLWNNDIFREEEKSDIEHFSNGISKYFTLAVLIIALVGAALNLPYNFDKAINVFTAVLIVACPCALALAIPFTYGNVLRIFGRNKFYLKNSNVIEKLSRITTIVFDKTGTITQSNEAVVSYEGEPLSSRQLSLVKSLVRQSTHPLSRKIYNYLNDYDTIKVEKFREYPGQGISANFEGNRVKIGSLDFIFGDDPEYIIDSASKVSTVYLSIDNEPAGCFKISNSYRKGLRKVLNNLDKKYDLHLLTGDNNNEREILLQYFKDPLQVYCNLSPESKMKYIKRLQDEGEKVLMIGDGLNDAGALKQSDVGISISENISNFSPACDGILDASKFTLLPEILDFAKRSKKIIITSFAFSFIYNIIALFFAFEGLLKPIMAAILMPVSSISVVLFSVIITNILSKKKNFG